jgi:hypothetical protein
LFDISSIDLALNYFEDENFLDFNFVDITFLSPTIVKKELN